MKKILVETGYDIYDEGIDYKNFADKILKKVYNKIPDESDLPIDPFKILSKTGARYMFQDFEAFEGIYLLPDDSKEDTECGYVSININRPIERQRFSAAHELCHHLKDETSGFSKQGERNPVEIYANGFASELLMPTRLITEILENKNLNVGDLDEVLIIANQFGVSFLSTLIKISNILKWRYTSDQIRKMARTYKPNKKRKDLGIDNQLELYKQVINSYNFIEVYPPKKIKTDFLRHVIANDHMIENGNVSEERINEILSLIRLYGVKEANEKYEFNNDEIEVVGQHLMYDSLFDKEDKGKSLSLLREFQEKLYCLTPFPEYAGQYRDTPTRISGTLVSTTAPHLIYSELYGVCDRADAIYNMLETEEKSKIIEHSAEIHHEITVIHPFNDGNGRTSRALMNYQFIQCDLPPIYISETEKDRYKDSLKKLDYLGDVPPNIEPMLQFLIKKIIDNFSLFIPLE